MLKLLKYEMIQNYRSFALIFAVFLLACVMLPFLPLEIFEIANATMMMVIAGISITVFVTIVRGYYTSMFEKPGYLTLTLPVSTHQIVLSKIIAAVIWWALTGIVTTIGIVTIIGIAGSRYIDRVTMNQVIYQIKVALSYLGLYNIVAAVKVVTALFLGLLSSITGIFALVTVVQTKYTRKHKVLAGFIIYIVYTIVLQTLFTGVIFTAVFSDGGISSNINLYFTFALLVSTIKIIIFYLVTIFVIDKKIEVE